MRRYHVFFESIGRNPTSPRIDPETLKWLPLMFIVVCLRMTAHLSDLRSLPLRPCPHPTTWSLQMINSFGRDGFTVRPEVVLNMPKPSNGIISMFCLLGYLPRDTCELNHTRLRTTHFLGC